MYISALISGREWSQLEYFHFIRETLDGASNSGDRVDGSGQSAPYTFRKCHTSFDLPSEITTACEQYLMYFRDFLSTIGIDAETEIRRKANQVLFTVTPDDPAIALENIQKALQIYLELPQHQYSIVTDDPGQRIQALQLQSEIQSYQSRLTLAAAVIQAKEATIAAKEAQIQAITLSGTNNPLLNALSAAPHQTVPPEKEAILWNMFLVKSVDVKVGDINLPHLIRVLRKHCANRKRDVQDVLDSNDDEPTKRLD